MSAKIAVTLAINIAGLSRVIPLFPSAARSVAQSCESEAQRLLNAPDGFYAAEALRKIGVGLEELATAIECQHKGTFPHAKK